MNTETVALTAEDGHQFDAFLAHPEGTPKGGIVVIQEIFGVTGHIQKMTELFADAGYLSIAPAMFDRVSAKTVLDYSDFDTARSTMEKLDRDQCVMDMRAATEHVRSAGRVGITGFCWGGSMADLAACHGLVDAGVSFYGRMTVEWLDLQPACPMFYHYGEIDQLIPWETIEKIQRKRNGQVRIWGNADHGFLCEDRPSYNKKIAAESIELTL